MQAFACVDYAQAAHQRPARAPCTERPAGTVASLRSAGRAVPRTTAVQRYRGAPSRQLSVPCSAAASVSSSATKDNEYNRVMQQQMGWGHLNPYEYHFDRGLYYHEVAEHVICGTQPRNRDDVRILAETQGVTTILNVRRSPCFLLSVQALHTRA